jgi:hypothetical protein
MSLFGVRRPVGAFAIELVNVKKLRQVAPLQERPVQDLGSISTFRRMFHAACGVAVQQASGLLYNKLPRLPLFLVSASGMLLAGLSKKHPME